jgi:spermidine synthase
VSFYSTLGSVAGALATGFFLIPRFAVSHIFYGAGALVLAAIGLVALDRRRPTAAAVAAAAALAAFGLLVARPEPARADVLYDRETFYGQLTVLEARPYRYLLLDGIHQSLWSAETQENIGQYIRGLELGPLVSGGERALVIGIGAGTLPVILERYYGMVADSVDVNAKIVDVAREFFAFETKGKTTVEDGRTFVHRCPDAAYDLVVLDTFSGDAVPYHLLTQEFFGELRRILKPGGVLAVNTVGLFRERTHVSPDVKALAATLAAHFPERRVFALLDNEERRKDPGLGNVLAFASTRPIAPRPGAPWRPSIRETLTTMLEHEIPLGELAGGLRLTDDYNPIDLLYAETAREWRRRTIEWSSR